MKLLRLVPLLALPFLFLGATCVTKVEQKGPTGPWVGEITNTGSDPEIGVRVDGLVIDSSGARMGSIYGEETCPFDLLPGEKGYFTQDAVSTDSGAPLPLQLTSFDTFSCGFRPLTTGLTFHVVETFPDHNSALVEMRNDSQNTYHDVNVCGLLFNRSGDVQEIGESSPFPAATFKPGDTLQFPITFNSPIDGPLQFAAKSAVTTRQDVLLDAWHFELSASRVVQTEQGRELQVVGEIRNDSPLDLEAAQYEFYLASSPTVRASGWVGSYGYLGRGTEEAKSWGTGFIPAGQKAPIVFSLPLAENDSPHIEFAGVSAHAASTRASRIPVTNVTIRREESDSVYAAATFTNPFNAPMEFLYCFELRGARGQLVGASCEFSCGAMAEPWTESKEVTEVAPMQSVEVVAYGWPGACPVSPPGSPPPRCP